MDIFKVNRIAATLLFVLVLITSAAAEGLVWIQNNELETVLSYYELSVYQKDEQDDYVMVQYANDEFSRAVITLEDQGIIFAVYVATTIQADDLWLQDITNVVVNPEDRLTQLLLNSWLKVKIYEAKPESYSVGMLGDVYFEFEQVNQTQWLRITDKDYFGHSWLE